MSETRLRSSLGSIDSVCLTHIIARPVLTGLSPLPSSLLLHGLVPAPSYTSSGHNYSPKPFQILLFYICSNWLCKATYTGRTGIWRNKDSHLWGLLTSFIRSLPPKCWSANQIHPLLVSLPWDSDYTGWKAGPEVGIWWRSWYLVGKKLTGPCWNRAVQELLQQWMQFFWKLRHMYIVFEDFVLR